MNLKAMINEGGVASKRERGRAFYRARVFDLVCNFSHDFY
jgi:hypothetical protein